MTEIVQDNPNEALWRQVLQGEHPTLRRFQRFFTMLPRATDPRCGFCFCPFEGISAPIARLFGKKRWAKNPYYCTACEELVQNYPGGAEIELTMFFADVRGSTTIAEKMRPTEFSRLMQRFYSTAAAVLIENRGTIDKFIGDAAVGFFVPAYTGHENEVKCAVNAGRELLLRVSDLPIGVGLHSGVAFVGSIGSESGVRQLTALGDAVNVAARLGSVAEAGELVMSFATYQKSGLDLPYTRRNLSLKGHEAPVEVCVYKV